MRRYGFTLVAFALLLSLPAPAQEPGQPAASASEVTPPLIGSKFPELTLTSGSGEAFDLAAAMRSKPSIVILYRGGW